MADGIAPAAASLIRLAAHGLWFTELLSFSLDEGLRSAVHELLGQLGLSVGGAGGAGSFERAGVETARHAG